MADKKSYSLSFPVQQFLVFYFEKLLDEVNNCVNIFFLFVLEKHVLNSHNFALLFIYTEWHKNSTIFSSSTNYLLIYNFL